MDASASCPTEFVDDIAPLQVPRLVGQGQPRARRAAGLHLPAGRGPHLRGAISISPSVDYMERAYDEAKYGEFSRRPYIDMVIPSLTDPSVAPPGKHVMSCFVQYAPYKLAAARWDDQREAFGDTVIDTIAEYAPNIRDIILHRQVLTPLDIERDVRADRRQHLSGRADARAAVLPAAGAGMGAVHDADSESLDVRLGDASRRRHHGRAGAERGAAILGQDPCTTRHDGTTRSNVRTLVPRSLSSCM